MNSFTFKKKFGQNFLTDQNLLKSICQDAGISKTDEVLEIGPGMGALTKHLCKAGKKVVAYEIDVDLKDYLNGLEQDNLKVEFKDILKKNIENIENNFKNNYKLVANLPYYITTPILFKFFNEAKKLESLTIMVQKEVGERMCAKVGETNYGALSVCCAFFGEPKIMRIVSKKMFHPQPDVDSCIVRLDFNKRFDVDKKSFFEIVKIAFKSRRKTLLNNFAEGLNLKKADIEKVDFDFSRRAENLTVDEFVWLTNVFGELVSVVGKNK